LSKKAFICLAVVALFATTATAVPITLPTEQVAKLKFTNFENVVDNNKNGIIDTGDDIIGILQVTSIGTIGSPNLYNGQLGAKELTGYFQISVVGGSVSGPFPQHVDFALQSGDFINLYVGTGATKNWNPGVGGVANDITEASDGLLWASVTSAAPGFYQAVGDTSAPGGSGDTVNTNFANLTVNNTDYVFIPQLFSTLGIGDPTAHTYLGTFFPDVLAEVFFKSRLFVPSGISNWQFRSEDPMYLWAVPEPGTFVLLGAGIAGIGLLRLRRRRK
jgi:hypothetical protein